MAGIPLLRSDAIFGNTTGLALIPTYLYFVSNTFLQCSSISSQLMRLLSIAALIFSITCSTSPGKQSISLPAIKDCTEDSPSGKNFFTPCISNASVKVRPWYPSLSLNNPVTFFLEIEVALFAAVSIAGI